MADCFFDTPGLVKRHVNETGSAWVRSLIRGKAAHRIYIARITAVEVFAAITRRQRDGRRPRSCCSAADFAASKSWFPSGEAITMLTYKAAYQFVEGGVHAHVLDFPGAITCGSDMAEARRLLASALLDMAALALERGEPLPRPDPSLSDPDADIEEPVHLRLRASTGVEVRPAGVVVP
jgi:predicted RNase H-like HicB family nuclease